MTKQRRSSTIQALLVCVGAVGLGLLVSFLGAAREPLEARPLQDAVATAETRLAGSTRGPDGKALNGVIVSAQAVGGTITTSVFSDEQGDYFFPPLSGGQYRVWAQAEGFDTARADVTLTGSVLSKTFELKRIADITPQLSGSEWLASLPSDTKEHRRMGEIFRVNCTLCHSAALPLQMRYDERGWRAIIDLML